jgi:hypothetical protein
MSQNSIRTALATALAAITPELATAWENRPTTKAGVEVGLTADPYQIVNVLFNEPDNMGYGNGPYTEMGIMQVRLMYPEDAGSYTAGARAELIRTTFYRGLSLASGGITTIIERTPTIQGGQVEEGRYAIIVKIRFFANIIP